MLYLSVGSSCATSNTVFGRSFVRNLESSSHRSSSVAPIWSFCVVNAQGERIFLLANHVADLYKGANKRPRKGQSVYIDAGASSSTNQTHLRRHFLDKLVRVGQSSNEQVHRHAYV